MLTPKETIQSITDSPSEVSHLSKNFKMYPLKKSKKTKGTYFGKSSHSLNLFTGINHYFLEGQN